MARSDMSDLEWEFIKAVLPNKTRARSGWMTGVSSTAFSTFCASGFHGLICPANTARRRPSTTVSTAGAMQVTGTASWKPSPTLITSIRSWWTARRSVPIILPPRSKKDPRRCLGRSRGGLGTKIHALTNQDGLPIRYELTPGQAHDAPPCKTLLDNLQPGQHVLADKAYDADWIRDMIWEQGAIDVIPPKANRKLPAEFDAEIYRERTRSSASLAD